jgi:capsular exopolysaccharide synthesis family protein
MSQENTQLVRATPELRHLERPFPGGNLSSGYLYETAPESEHVAYLREFLRSLRKHLWLVVGLTLCATAASAVYNARKPDIYEARAQVRVDQENNAARGAVGPNAPIIVNSGQTLDPQYFNTQLQILTSPALMRRVVKQLDLEHTQAFFRSPNENRTVLQSLLYMAGVNKDTDARKTDDNAAPIAPAGKAGNTQAPSNVEDALEEAKRLDRYVRAIMGNLKVTQVRDTRIINVSFQHQDAQLAAKVANTIADIYVQSNMATKTGNMDTEGVFLKQRISQLQNEIKNDNQRLNDYAKTTGTLALGDKSQDVVVERLAALNRELVLAENARRLAEAQYKVGSEQKVVDAVNSKETIDLEKRLQELEQQRAKLSETFTPEWRGVKEVEAQIAEIRKQIDSTKNRRSSTTLTALEANYREAMKREQDLRAAFEKQKVETRSQNTTAVNYKIIQDEIDTKKKLLDDLIQKDKQLDMARAGNTNNISILDYGLIPTAPIGPKRTQGILLAFLMSFAFGIGLARLLDYMDTTVRTVQDIEKHLRLPVLSLIPSVGGWRRIAPSSALQKADGFNPTEELLIRSDMRSPLAETYRQLRTSILLSTAGRAPKTLLVTSSQASEGKTTNAVNVAYTLTQTGAKVLIIDADMRRPRLHSIFQVENNRGLSTILSSEMSEAEILTIVNQYESTGVYVLPSGPLPPNPSELLSSEAMRRLLTILEGTFTHVVIDSPPITLVTDSVILGSMVDGVLLVVQGDRTSRELVRRSQRLLHEVGARIFGVILNNVNVKPEDYYYYQSYYSSNYYAGDKG